MLNHSDSKEEVDECDKFNTYVSNCYNSMKGYVSDDDSDDNSKNIK